MVHLFSLLELWARRTGGVHGRVYDMFVVQDMKIVGL